MKSRFSAGSPVFYPYLKAQGTVTAVINAQDHVDVARQGFRYEVEFRGKGGQVWSVLDSELQPGRAKKQPKLPPKTSMNLTPPKTDLARYCDSASF